MSANYQELLVEVKSVALFAKRIGAKKEAATMEKLHGKLLANKKSSKVLEEEVFHERGLASYYIPSFISKQKLDAPTKEQLNAEFFALRRRLDAALIPEKPAAFPETDIQGLAGNKEFTRVYGDPKSAPAIATSAMDVVQRFSVAVFKQDLETAYALCANELRGWMSIKRFFTELQKAVQHFGGKAVECKIERIASIEADADVRQKRGNNNGDWPKDTPRANKRAIVGTFWVTNPATSEGRWVMLWVTEESEGYRVAKFNQYLQ